MNFQLEGTCEKADAERIAQNRRAEERTKNEGLKVMANEIWDENREKLPFVGWEGAKALPYGCRLSGFGFRVSGKEGNNFMFFYLPFADLIYFKS
jgi:hypothetical protein